MYKGEDTWVQGNSIIYTFSGSTGSEFYYSDKNSSQKIKGDGNQQELYEAIKIVLDSWKWLYSIRLLYKNRSISERFFGFNPCSDRMNP